MDSIESKKLCTGFIPPTAHKIMKPQVMGYKLSINKILGEKLAGPTLGTMK